MKYTTLLLTAALALPAGAATIAATAGSPTGGQGYTWHVELAPGDDTSFSGTVGSWSWEDKDLSGAIAPNTGWRHQADWLLVTLTNASKLTLDFSRLDDVADLKLFPSFTLFTGMNDTADGAHFWGNEGDVQWTATSAVLGYVAHVDNSVDGATSTTYALPAGTYTIGFGGNAQSEPTAVNVNYSAALSVSPIPEPSSGLLALVGAAALLRRRR